MLKKTFSKKMNHVLWVLLFSLGVIGISACSDNDKSSSGYDSGKPVEITGFEPKKGAARTRLYISGKNFGSDVSQIHVKVGGVDAKVIGCNGEIIYCIVPPKANEGSVEVAIGQTENYVKANELFDYEARPQVKTLCGYKDEYGKSEAKDGSFEEAGFTGPRWLVVDPKNKDHLYLVDGQGAGDNIRMLDVTKREVISLLSRGQLNLSQIRQINFTTTGDTLLIASEADPENYAVVAAFREYNYTMNPKRIGWVKMNNACGTHPVNGELYYNSRDTGTLYHYDWKTDTSTEVFNFAAGSQFFIFFHPSGDYAYINVPNKKVIYKAEYDWGAKCLVNPTPFAGKEGSSGSIDGVGEQARLGNPFQGCFVKNEKYVAQGKEDVYDFYFADQHAHSIRYLTPDAEVVTFAGRGSIGPSDDGSGYVDGDLLKEARFHQPLGLIYDDDRKIFYISELANARIRVIEMEAE